MSVTVRSVATASAVKGAGATLSATSVAGDLAFIIMSGQLTSNSGLLPGVPAGWTGEVTHAIGTTGRMGYVAWRRVTDPAQTQGVSWFSTSASWTARQNGVLVVLSGVESAVVAPWQAGVPAVSGTCLLASQAHGAAGGTADSWTANNVLVDGESSATASWSALRVALTSIAPGGSTALVKAWASVSLTPTPDPVPTPPPVSTGVEAAGKAAAVSVWDGAREVAARMRALPSGARTVASLLARPRFIVAHRGGSGSWPEHTMRAYTQSVAAGVDALEISCARTSDGVWIGSHDKSLARIGGPAEDVSALTWAQIQSAMAGSANLPVTLDALLAAYGRSHVIVFDPKAEASRSAEYMAILEPYRSSVILKFSGDGAALFKAWKAAGWTTWAYGYASWKASNQSAWAALTTDTNKDVLSMEHSADAAIWAELVALGRPVTSHIPATAAQVTAGWERGAVGSIVAGVAAVLAPRV